MPRATSSVVVESSSLLPNGKQYLMTTDKDAWIVRVSHLRISCLIMQSPHCWTTGSWHPGYIEERSCCRTWKKCQQQIHMLGSHNSELCTISLEGRGLSRCWCNCLHRLEHHTTPRIDCQVEELSRRHHAICS